MSRLLSRWQPPDAQGCTQSITPERAGWGHVGFAVFELEAGRQLTLPAVSEERCLVLVAGRASITAPTARFANIGERMSPFERKKPWAVYVAPGETVQVQAETRLELAVCAAPSQGTWPTRLIAPQDIDAEARGKGNNRRYVHNILPQDKPADSLLVVEVWTDEGCTSSYPSHKHDTDNPPQETCLEETYYHRLNPEQGFCMQRVYTDDRALDECMAVYNRDVVMVPQGYHPVATMAGYDSYYLNVMAGPVRRWMFTWEACHGWINQDYPRK
ncbi:5-deoxy-glucuronate isomerase [Edwardsiella ictaluri]|uniref:Myo-inositol catabolism protein IolB, putative n=1 Tax=Edwardsiella ictaluri (strain 93-146) TaxID=634503 RepID=C5BE63_EDWI9|nr:5-deoxy-glucuronate isomerase [Edwardsiella ictaluri]ACR69304.1 myo-inositol catabolism protein IolB, putative [Edwardsiella ictaluri 93-146]ARD38540.1 5-deoxy-glucuronate isomerase [Edwardsiella ictaluri]AVZ83647.1 5-deoxy-glucuronate isomerase [Edwardsiella ictaluri]EKS7764695.1 5-deoxy-glucuronate isomerase [Edwardsiella ictaluri]EKS7771528.1 5-deoxy-glucuronate isomerase [Edwardsiella ictaluri]